MVFRVHGSWLKYRFMVSGLVKDYKVRGLGLRASGKTLDLTPEGRIEPFALHARQHRRRKRGLGVSGFEVLGSGV